MSRGDTPFYGVALDSTLDGAPSIVNVILPFTCTPARRFFTASAAERTEMFLILSCGLKVLFLRHHGFGSAVFALKQRSPGGEIVPATREAACVWARSKGAIAP